MKPDAVASNASIGVMCLLSRKQVISAHGVGW